MMFWIKKYRLYAVCALMGLLSTSTLSAEETIWISNEPSAQCREKIAQYGMHKISSMRVARGKEKIVQWIRSGVLPATADYLDSASLGLFEPVAFSPDGEPVGLEFKNCPIGYKFFYDGSKEGFYNIYIIRKFVKNDTLFVQTAKAERLSHKCMNGHKLVKKKIPYKIFPDAVPFEITRERIAQEDFHTFLASGDNFSFKAYYRGKPVQNASLFLATQKGWGKTMVTNESGEASFQLIGDYFTKWKELEKNKIFTFLLTADYIVDEQGVYNDVSYEKVHYTCTYSDSYIPPETLYKSFTYPLFLIVIVIVATGLGIFIYRERRKRPYKEVVFNEKD